MRCLEPMHTRKVHTGVAEGLHPHNAPNAHKHRQHRPHSTALTSQGEAILPSLSLPAHMLLLGPDDAAAVSRIRLLATGCWGTRRA